MKEVKNEKKRKEVRENGTIKMIIIVTEGKRRVKRRKERGEEKGE